MKNAFFWLLGISSSLTAFEGSEELWEMVAPSVQEYQSSLQQAIAAEDWWSVIDYGDIIFYHFPDSPFAEETPFFVGEAYFRLGQLELANEQLTTYLNHALSPKRLEEAIVYKFTIAEAFRKGAKKPLFGSHKMPKIVSAQEDAVKIYEEVITTLPHSEIAVQSLLGKAELQAELGDYKPSLETLELLIRRFPKHDFAAEAYLEKARVYLLQCQKQSPDPDLLDLAEINLRKFRLAFPREPRLVEAEKTLTALEEIFANNLYEIGCFFEKTKKVPASQIYYKKVISKYPMTEAAGHARKKVEKLGGDSHSL